MSDAMTVVMKLDAGVSVVCVDGPLRSPVSSRMRSTVRAHLERGERNIVLDLNRVSEIDAAGLSELVDAYNMTAAAGGVLRITHPTTRVREFLDRVGLFDLLINGT